MFVISCVFTDDEWDIDTNEPALNSFVSTFRNRDDAVAFAHEVMADPDVMSVTFMSMSSSR